MSLAKRFSALWNRIGAKGDSEPVYVDLARRYGEFHRDYHTLPHIAFGLKELDDVPSLQCNKDLVELAFWFHDAVYRISWLRPVKDNEEKSAGFANKVLKKAKISSEDRTLVMMAILDTAHKGFDTIWETSKFVVDIDLAIFGQSPLVYEKFEKAIRREYWGVPLALYRHKRAELLQKFLDRERIYYTEFFYNKYEKQARENLTRTIAELKGKPQK